MSEYKTNNKSILFTTLTCIVFLSGFLVSCATVDKPAEPTVSVFYPPLPNSPRIQYLTRFSKVTDLRQKKTGFSRFILGRESQLAEMVKKPYGVAIHDGKIYVVDTRGPGYAVLDLAAKRYNFVEGNGNGKMKKPINMVIDNNGHKYVSDTERNQILVFDQQDRFVRAYGQKDQFKPSDVAVTADRLYIADVEHHQIQVLDKISGNSLFVIGKPGSRKGELLFPTNLKISGDNHVYVTDTGNFRIQKFTLDGKHVRSIGKVGTGLGHFARPKGIALDRQGRLYVVDAAFENVQLMSKNTELLLFFGGAGDKPENINLPTDIEIDYDSVSYFQQYADPSFKLEYVIFVVSQFGKNKVSVFGFGEMEKQNY